MTFLQTFKTNPSGTRTRRVVFPRLDLNPNIPSRPGEPGLIFASRHEILENPPWTLFVKLRNETPAVWLYLGEYKCTLSGKMTAEQFAGQGPTYVRWFCNFVCHTSDCLSPCFFPLLFSFFFVFSLFSFFKKGSNKLGAAAARNEES